jgi:sugar lactone lactonase YvrE
MKSSKVSYLFATIASVATVLLPICAFAAPQILFESDSDGGTIFKFTPDGTKTIFASGLSAPVGLALDAVGNLFEADELSGKIFRFTPDGTKTTFATGLNGPFGLAFDAAGNLFEADDGSGTIFKFTPDGTRTTFATGLSFPTALAFDRMGNLFAASASPNAGSGSIFKFTPDGTKSTFATGLKTPIGLAFSASGNLLVPDPGSGTIFKFTPTGTKTIFAGAGDVITALAFDSFGNLFVASNNDGGNNGGIYVFTPGGTPKSIFASGLSGGAGLAFQPATLPPAPPAQLLNISARLKVLIGDNVLIGGFVISGSDNKQVLLRALGSTLGQFGVSGVLTDPTLELHDGTGAIIASNDNWTTAANKQAIIDSGFAPPDALEPAILYTLPPGSYTVVVRGKNASTGVALVEAYDLSPGANASLSNSSARGFVDINDDVMIGGFITGEGNCRVIVRALGPTLAQFGVPNVLADPMLELYDANGTLIASNDNTNISPFHFSEIRESGFAPPNGPEPAIIITRPAGNTTAIVRGKNNTTGNALLEVYTLPL